MGWQIRFLTAVLLISSLLIADSATCQKFVKSRRNPNGIYVPESPEPAPVESAGYRPSSGHHVAVDESEVSDLELEIIEAGYLLKKGDTATLRKLVANYKIRLQRLCPSGPQGVAERASAQHLDACVELIDKILELDDEDPDAICSQHGEDSEHCQTLKPKSTEKEADVYTKLESLLNNKSKTPPAGAGIKKNNDPDSIPVPAALRPLQDKISELAVELMKKGSPQVRVELKSLYQEMVTKLCPDPANAQTRLSRGETLSPPSESCKYYANALARFDPGNLLPSCYLEGYDSSTCSDYLNLSEISPAGRGNRNGGQKDDGFTRF